MAFTKLLTSRGIAQLALCAAVVLFFGLAAAAPQKAAGGGGNKAATSDWHKLGAFRGTWKGHGELFKTPYTPAKQVDSTTTCTWSKHGDYLICDQMNTMPAHQLTIYSATPDGSFIASTIGRPGTPANSTKLTLSGTTWTYSSDYEHDGKKTYFRTTNSFTSPEIYTFEAQYSEDGQHWMTMAQGESHRISK